LTLATLFSKGFDYAGFLTGRIRQKIQAEPEKYFGLGDVSGFQGLKCDHPYFYLTPDALVIYFPLYDIAPYSSGIPEFRILWADMEKGLKVRP
jgi:hypothetical protein